ncbi:DUF1428 domain-containing protein [Sphingomonas bacterium]|uniref:DUF1428 domain-containing protein n=1 Tax=Sphingomonas bacterium TaxID=1895847 RepID=UPI002A0E9EA9|nr:hypothetical protein [Sphingomonas bacterium]
MSYFQGFVIPVPEGKKQAYLDLAIKVSPMFAEFGATRTVECWEESVPDGKRTDLRRAVNAEPGEKIVYSWVWWPDKATCDAAAAKMMADERMQPDDDMPFDGKRMIYAGFDAAYDSGDGGKFGYVDAIVAPAPDDRAGYAENAAKLDAFFIREGALRTVDGWGADVPDGKVTDFKQAVAAEPGEQVVFGWIEWPDKATRDAAFAKVMQDPEMQAIKPAFDMQRAIFGGFVPILDTDHD